MKAILFDKDGTLLDFEALWLPVAEKAISLLSISHPSLKAKNREAMEAMGIFDGKIDVTGCLCGGTYKDISKALAPLMCEEHTDKLTTETEKAFSDSMDEGETRLIHPRLKEILNELKSQGKKLFVVTADSLPIAINCLKKLDIIECFDEVLAAGEKCPSKPDPYYINYISSKYNIPKSEMCMVGDTPTDMNFAKNGGVKAFAVGSSKANLNLLSPLAAATAKTPVELYENGKF